MAVEMTNKIDETMVSDEREKDNENETTENRLSWNVYNAEGDWVKVEYVCGKNTQVTCAL